MKNKRICAALLVMCALSMTACGNRNTSGTQQETEIRDYNIPDDFEPTYYVTEEELPGSAYYIVHKEGDETRYYPLLNIEKTYSKERTSVEGSDSSRVCWVNYNIDEGLIPTMHKGDQMIYKSETYIPTEYYLEKFFDEGYTFGVSGLYQDASGNYRYNKKKCDTMSTSDVAGIENLDADSIYIITIDDTPLDPTMISPSGTITGLNLMQSYKVDIRTGTEQVLSTLTCNIHYFTSAETYKFTEFSFISEHVAELSVPDYAKTGYYSLGGGFFRYIADDTDYHALSEDDYNHTIYVYSEKNKITGTSVGLVFNANDILVQPGDLLNQSAFEDGTIGAYLEEAGVNIYDLSVELGVDSNKFYNMLSDDASNYETLDVDSVIEELKQTIRIEKLLNGEIDLGDIQDTSSESEEDSDGDRCIINSVSDAVEYEDGRYYDISYTDYTTGNDIVARLYIPKDDLATYPPVVLETYYIKTSGTTHNDYQGLEITSMKETKTYSSSAGFNSGTEEVESEDMTNE